MKKLLILFLLFFLSFNVWSQESQEIKINPSGLKWDAVTENTDGSPITDLAGYKIYWGNVSGDRTNSKDIPLADLSDINNPNYLIDYTTAIDGIYFYVVTAFDNAENESGYSNEVLFEIDKTSPANCKNLQTTGGIVIIINNYP